MSISAELVRKLREKTGAGIMDCKTALIEAKGDFERALAHLREKGLASALKKAGRTTADGTVVPYIHPGSKIGVLLEVNCETDFVAKTADFQTLSKDIAMHIAAMNPLYIKREDVPAELVSKEREIYMAEARREGKPQKALEKIADGKLDKFFKETCLMEQSFVKEPDATVSDVLSSAIAKLGENIQVRRFVRFKVGEEA